jgi:hypothetical protein
MTTPTVVTVNLAGFIETPSLGSNPYQVDADGRPYLPVGDGGIVLGVELGDSVFAAAGDHVAPGATLSHPDQAARHALTTFACAGNEVVLRGGAAAGAIGRVLGKRGEAGRVIVVFEPEVLARLAPGDPVMVRSHGQGARLSEALADAGATVLNIAPALLDRLGVRCAETMTVSVRAAVPSKLVGNGLGRPAQQWDLDLSVDTQTAGRWGLSTWRLGDLIAITDLDIRHNAGYRRGWTTVGITVHGGSPLPGHGPGVMPILSAPTSTFDLQVDGPAHVGVNGGRIQFGRD